MVFDTGGMNGRVLLVTKTDFAAPRDGGTLRVSAIVSCLQAAGFSVDSVPIRSADGKRHRPNGQRTTRRSLANGDWWMAASRVATFTARVGSVSVARWYSPAAAERIASLFRHNRYAAVLIEYSQLLVYRSLFKKTPVILDMHNIEYELLANYTASAQSVWTRLLARYETSRVRRLELRARNLTDAIVTVSEHDADMIRLTSGGAVVVTAPNGVSESAFDVVRTTTENPAVVFIGHLGWQPNVDAAHWLVRSVWPAVNRSRPMAALQLIGQRPAKSLLNYDGIDGISVHPDVPSTLPFLGAAAVATAPLRAAGGTRLKILEAMATGTPVVATSLGAMGLEHLARGGAMVIADDPDDFAEALMRFIESRSDPELVRQEVDPYRWSLALQPLVDVLMEKANHPCENEE